MYLISIYFMLVLVLCLRVVVTRALYPGGRLKETGNHDAQIQVLFGSVDHVTSLGNESSSFPYMSGCLDVQLNLNRLLLRVIKTPQAQISNQSNTSTS